MILGLALAAVLAVPRITNPDAEILGEMDESTLASALGGLGKALGGDGKKRVVLRLSTPGGDGIATLVFIQKARDMLDRNHAKMDCVGDIMVASAGAILMESDVCETRTVTDTTMMLFHGIAAGARGKVREIEEELQLLKGLDRIMANFVGPRMGMSPDEYLAWIDMHDRWLTPAEAKARGAVDFVVDVSARAVAAPAAESKAAKPDGADEKKPEPKKPSCPVPVAHRAKEWFRHHRLQLTTGLAILNGCLALLALALAGRRRRAASRPKGSQRKPSARSAGHKRLRAPRR